MTAGLSCYETWIEIQRWRRRHRVRTARAADGILERERGGYRASHIALYSSFQAPSRLPAPLTTNSDTQLTRARNPADI
jgi:hypothetical protein